MAMLSKRRKGFALRKKLCVLKYITNSKSVRKNSIIMDTCVYIYKLKLQLKAIQNECHYVRQHHQEVKVENIGNRYIEVKVASKKGKDLLLPVLQVLETMNLRVVHAKVTCNYIFGMEAIVEDLEEGYRDLGQVREAILKAAEI